MNEDFLQQNQQLESIDSESKILALRSKLDTTYAEEFEIIESGFSFSSSLKDISKYIIVSLLEQLSQDLYSVFYIIDNWERFIIALDNPGLIDSNEEILFNTFTNVYYESIGYFKRQFLSHLGEKVELDSQDIQDPIIQELIGQTGFKQRKFTYSIQASGPFSIQQVTASTIKSFEIRNNEREKIEMFNSILLRLILRPYEYNLFIASLIEKFPELENELINLLHESKRLILEPGDNLIEISPPFEKYSYQKECMVRIYTFNGHGFDITQYSIPYVENEIEVVKKNILLSFNTTAITTARSNEYESSDILGTMYLDKYSKGSAFINSFPSIVDYGGVNVIDTASDFITPRINMIGNIIHPFIVEYISSPSFLQNGLLLPQFSRKYSEIFMSAIATLDINIRNDNPEVETLLESGELLSAAVNGISTSEALSIASSGEISSLDINSDGYCDTLSGTIGGTNQSLQDNFTESEVKEMVFAGKVTSLSKEVDINLDLMKFIDKDGNEKKLFICPVCSEQGLTNYIDICAEQCSKCKVNLTDLRIASEKKDLRNFVKGYSVKANSSSNGIFNVLFDLFGAVFSIFN